MRNRWRRKDKPRKGTDGESRRVRLKVQNGEVIILSPTEELASKFNQNCRCENISAEQTPFDNAPVKSDGTIKADINPDSNFSLQQACNKFDMTRVQT
ncbi:hypothetical protein AVEN_248028-1 [Araneus ventricosus]|uniref:Uncharacterized protein n=1 Tax=Araneus ventricosus TaxID=182803 RepID=A0A4Y2JK86_ARAVE|nr:hypothetical protein AVEN_248028-1 [Araneus ventricosus]